MILVSTQSRSDPRRQSILQAALKCFTSDGYDSAAIEDICRISGASIGSIYHHFGSKEDLAAALYEEGITEYQSGLLTILADEANPNQVIPAIVRHHLTWVRQSPEWARYLLQMGAAPATAAARPAVKRRNAELLNRVEAWMRPHAAAGRLVDVPAETLTVLVLGPCHAAARAALSGGMTLDDPTIDLLAAATLRAVTPASGGQDAS